jgi:hypothetical protein
MGWSETVHRARGGDKPRAAEKPHLEAPGERKPNARSFAPFGAVLAAAVAVAWLRHEKRKPGGLRLPKFLDRLVGVGGATAAPARRDASWKGARPATMAAAAAAARAQQPAPAAQAGPSRQPGQGGKPSQGGGGKKKKGGKGGKKR